MKQLSFLIVVTALGAVGAMASSFWAVMLYYSFAVLRPQAIWAWALPTNLRWSLIAALLLVVSCVIHGPRLLKTLRFNPVIVLMIAYTVWLLWSMLMAFDPYVAEQWGVEYAKVIFVAVLASFIVERYWHVRALSVMIAIALGYIAWEINFMYFFEHRRLDVYHIGFGGLDNNGAGLMLAMGLPFAYALLFLPKKMSWSWVRWLGLPIAVLLVHAVMMTYSRGAMLAALVGLGWLAAHHRPRWQAAGGVLALCLVIGMLAGPQIRGRFYSTTDYHHDASATARLDSWGAAWKMVWDEPLFGHGIRNASRFIGSYGADRAGRTIHSQYLQIAADSGLPAAMTYIAMLAVAFGSLRLARRRCLQALTDSPTRLTDDIESVEHLGHIWLATETGLVIFAFGGLFLSMEMFELPYLLLMFAGVSPMLTQLHIENAIARGERRKKQQQDAGDPHAQGRRLAGRFRPHPVLVPAPAKLGDHH